MPLKVIQHDILKMPVEAIVVPTYELQFLEYTNRFITQMTTFQYKIDGEKTTLTQAGLIKTTKMPFNHIIYVVGPHFYKGKVPTNIKLLKESYENCLAIALKHDFKSIAFPLISSGGKAFPKRIAFEVAKYTIDRFLENHDIDVYIVVYDTESILYAESYLEEVDLFLKDKINHKEKEVLVFPDKPLKTFHEILIEYLNQYEIDPVKMYKKAYISKAHFHKLITGKSQPSRKTALLLGVAMELTFEDTLHLLASAGYTFNTSSHFDLIIEYHIKREIYDLNQIDQTLYQYTKDTLMKYE